MKFLDLAYKWKVGLFMSKDNWFMGRDVDELGDVMGVCESVILIICIFFSDIGKKRYLLKIRKNMEILEIRSCKIVWKSR